jgi:hypothetical protein
MLQEGRIQAASLGWVLHRSLVGIYVIATSGTRNHHPTTFILGLVLAQMMRKIRLDSMRHKAERR